MNYIKYFIDEKNQTVLIVSGCSRRCKNCPNPKTQDYRSGNRFDDNARKNLFELLSESDFYQKVQSLYARQFVQQNSWQTYQTELSV